MLESMAVAQASPQAGRESHQLHDRPERSSQIFDASEFLKHLHHEDDGHHHLEKRQTHLHRVADKPGQGSKRNRIHRDLPLAVLAA